jgi:transcriptional regulator with XRE-family HTH domain
MGRIRDNRKWMKIEDVRLSFGKTLRAIRKQHGFSQEGLAHLVGLDRSYIGGVERGERNISLLNICRIARALKVAPSVLMDFSLK